MSFRVNFEKIHNFNFRVAILQIICTISNYIGTLNKKITSYSLYSQLKTLKAKIFISGFPKKACQGCHISKRARGIIFQLVSFNALGSKSMKTKAKCFANTIRELFCSRHFVTQINQSSVVGQHILYRMSVLRINTK